MKNKKAAVGATLTWVVATFIILFIMIVFLVFVGVKKISEGKIEVEINSLGKNDLFLAQSFYSFLKTKTESGENVKEEIYAWADGEDNDELIEKEFKEYFNESGFECSIAEINNKDKSMKVFDLSEYNGPMYSRPHQKSFLEQGRDFFLVSDDNLIKIRIYAGECKNGL